jgi:dGTPase
MLIREEIEEKEDKELAPYAMRSKYTRGRIHPEEEHPYRSVYQRDRDRIVHSTAFRRLEYKTQVFVNHEGDYYRTRLTHTLEVAQIARSIARALKLNEDLIEGIALAHDLGHTPFGHSGEEALHILMKDYGGFEHNRQGLRVVDLLEERYPNFKGLNLTWEVREGIIKHTTSYDHATTKEFEPEMQPSLEAQVVDIADEIAYDNHDLDDGVTSGLINEESLNEIKLWKQMSNNIKKLYPDTRKEIWKYQTIKSLINVQVTDVIEESERRLKQFKIASYAEVRECAEKIISFSSQMSLMRRDLRKFLLDYLYQHYRVVRMSDKAHRFIRDLFQVYLAKPEQLPPTSRSRLKEEETHRVICDYIAGMTDRYALDEYRKLFEPYERV